MKDYIIRKAALGDETFIHESHMRSIREVCIKDHGEEEIRGWGNRPLGNKWTEAIKNQHVWVVEVEGKIFGHGYIYIFSEDNHLKAHIGGLYLTPEVLGLGIGLKVAQLMIETAKKAGAEFITLESTLTAHEFYKKLGFKEIGPMGKIDFSGYPVRYFPMKMILT